MTATGRVAPAQRYTHSRRCPICGGRENDPRGRGVRCTGYLSEDGTAAFCSRVENDHWVEAAGCWVHRLDGEELPAPVRIGRIRRDEIPEDAVGVEPAGGREPSAIYDYQDVDGAVLFQALRYALPGGKKGFRQRRPLADGRWAGNLEGVRLVPYRLPELLETAGDGLPVFVVEGEKDVETLRSLGLVATTNPMGAGKWRDEYSEYLEGRTCYLIPDNDERGREHAKQVRRSLEAAGARAVLVSLGTLADKGDVTDWVDGGGTSEALARLCAVEEERYARNEARRNQPEEMTAAALRTQRYADIRWIVPGLLPEGTTLFAGKPKSGKSWLVFDLALAIARGGTLFDDDTHIQQGRVLYLALEDTFRRLQDRLFKIAAEPHPGDENLTLRVVSPSAHNGGLALIEAFCQANPDARCVVADTLAVFRGAPPKGGGGYADEYEVFRALKVISDLYSVAFVLVTHTKKGAAAEDEDEFEAILGSQAQMGAVDTNIVLRTNPATGRDTLSYNGRDVERDKLVIEWNQDLHRWRTSPEDLRSAANPNRQLLLDALGDAGPLTPAQLSDRTALNRNTVRSALRWMMKAGQVVKRADCYEVAGNRRENANNRTRPIHGQF